jgi:glycosyltransferase involved in cell wall biosynthesis
MPIEIEIVDSAPKNTTLCLNMIVKNESRIICRLLESVASLIDSYCICDTGSTDNTVDLIETFFQARGIPGKITREPFRDFAHNRTFSLNACEQIDADYILLLDADMVFQLHEDPQEFKNSLTHDYYHLFQGVETFYYKNTRIVKNRIGASYWGVTHEYVKMPEGSTYALLEKARAFIHDIGDGGAKADKFERDIRLLKQGLVDCPNNDRYTFYLANSYRDHGDHALAIEAYKKRAELGGWFEEVWHSYYSIGKCYRSMGDMANAIYWWLEAYQFFPKRIENLYEIITHYRQQGKNHTAYLFYSTALKQMLLNPNPDYLFLQKDVYDYKLDYEFSIFGYYCNLDGYDMTRICQKVLSSEHADEGAVRNVLSNYKFYAKKLVSYASVLPAHIKSALESVGTMRMKSDHEFVGSTPSLAWIDSNRLALCRRFVNYRINDRGGYENQSHIVTKNVIAVFDTDTWEKTDEYVQGYDTSLDNVYVGLEDVRLFYHEGKLQYNANRGLAQHKLAVEHGQVYPEVIHDRVYPEVIHDRVYPEVIHDRVYPEVIHDRVYPEVIHDRQVANETRSSGLVFIEGQKSVEKNWVMFEDANGKKKIVYGWKDLVIGDVVPYNELPTNAQEDSDDELEPVSGFLFSKTDAIKTPHLFKHVRGSTNGQRVGDEIWFICHVVSYEDRRYYYHLFVTIDASTYAVRRYTPMFTLEGDKVEYTLGFVILNDQVLIGYSKMDRTTEYMSVPVKAVEAMFIGITA